MGILSRVFCEFDDLFRGLFDSLVIRMHFSDDVIVSVNSTRDLAVSGDGGRSEGSERAESNDGSFHNGGKLAEGGFGASWDLASLKIDFKGDRAVIGAGDVGIDVCGLELWCK